MSKRFHPNDDGKNDKFEIIIEDGQDFHMKIFNRWGEVVYECNKLEDEWDGKIKGKQASEGVYYYVCRYWSECQLKFVQESGSVSLYR